MKMDTASAGQACRADRIFKIVGAFNAHRQRKILHEGEALSHCGGNRHAVRFLVEEVAPAADGLRKNKTRCNAVGKFQKADLEAGVSAIKGGRIALERIDDCLAKNISFTQETTLSGHKTEDTAARARTQGYHVRLYYVGLDTPEECLARIANRVRRGGHNIPENDVQRRFAGRWEAVEKVLPYCDEARFFDNDNGFMEVAEYRNGELVLKGERRPAWIKELAERLKQNP